jgi:hypothetical protein
MAPRNTISRITSRIDHLPSGSLPEPELITLVVADKAECQRRLEEMKAMGRVRFIITGLDG